MLSMRSYDPKKEEKEEVEKNQPKSNVSYFNWGRNFVWNAVPAEVSVIEMDKMA